MERTFNVISMSSVLASTSRNGWGPIRASVVHEHVAPLERAEEALDLLILCHVARHRLRCASGVSNFSFDLSELVARARDENDLCPCRRERQRAASPKPAARARHDDTAVLEVHRSSRFTRSR
jgi:hypothetical protein